MQVDRLIIKFFCVLLVAVIVTPIQVPFIESVALIAKSTANTTVLLNQTCQQCLCQSNDTYVALNCFSNNTCELFDAYPRAYTIDNTFQARLYFPQQVLPNASECCMSNSSYLLQQLNTVPFISVNVSSPRCLVVDNYGYIVTISQKQGTVVRLHPNNLTEVTMPASPTFTNWIQTIAYHDGAYYVGTEQIIIALNTSDFSVLANITAPLLNGTRGMMFLNGGQTMVVASTVNSYILFFNRTDYVSRKYSFVGSQSVSYSNPHGFWYVNDTYFYLTSWLNNSIYSYSAVTGSSTWTERLLLDATTLTNSSGGNHLSVDECNRYWFALGPNGLKIFDNQMLLQGTVSRIASTVFDVLISDNYVIYFPDPPSNRVIRIALNVTCSYPIS